VPRKTWPYIGSHTHPFSRSIALKAQINAKIKKRTAPVEAALAASTQHNNWKALELLKIMFQYKQMPSKNPPLSLWDVTLMTLKLCPLPHCANAICMHVGGASKCCRSSG